MVSATCLVRTKLFLAENVAAELVVFRVPEPVRGSRHYFKYRLALIADGVCVLRYDNEAGKGDHRHVGDEESPYTFAGLDILRRDFLLDARAWLERNGRH